MSLVPAKSIKTPKLKVTPPLWVKIAVGSALLLVFLAMFFLPAGLGFLRTVILSAYGMVLVVIVIRALDKNYLVTVQANRDGLYFQSKRTSRYFFVPWRCIGVIEKAEFPLNKRAIRIEVTGDYKGSISRTEHIGNVLSVEDRIFIYTAPQLNDRLMLIDEMNRFRRPVFE